MLFLAVTDMKIVDRALIDHLKVKSHGQEVHVIAPEVARELGVGLNTVYRSLYRLMHEGYLVRLAGNNRIGYTYHIRH